MRGWELLWNYMYVVLHDHHASQQYTVHTKETQVDAFIRLMHYQVDN